MEITAREIYRHYAFMVMHTVHLNILTRFDIWMRNFFLWNLLFLNFEKRFCSSRLLSCLFNHLSFYLLSPCLIFVCYFFPLIWLDVWMGFVVLLCLFILRIILGVLLPILFLDCILVNCCWIRLKRWSDLLLLGLVAYSLKMDNCHVIELIFLCSILLLIPVCKFKLIGKK